MKHIDIEEVKKNIPAEVLKALEEKAEQAAIEEHFCNVGEDEFPKDIWKELESHDDGDTVDIEGAVVWEPYEYYCYRDLISSMLGAEDINMEKMLYAIGVYQGAVKK